MEQDHFDKGPYINVVGTEGGGGWGEGGAMNLRFF